MEFPRCQPGGGGFYSAETGSLCRVCRWKIHSVLFLTGERQGDHGTAPRRPDSASPHPCACTCRHTHRGSTDIKVDIHTHKHAYRNQDKHTHETKRPTHQTYIITYTYLHSHTYTMIPTYKPEETHIPYHICELEHL